VNDVTTIEDAGTAALPSKSLNPRRPVRHPLSGSQVLGWLQFVAVVASMGSLLLAIPATFVGTLPGDAAFRVCLLVWASSLMAIAIGAIANSTDRLYGFPLKGGCWWNYQKTRHGVAIGCGTQVMLTVAMLETVSFALAILWAALR